jgi:D-alanyl-D-alanine carboxypeptidase
MINKDTKWDFTSIKACYSLFKRWVNTNKLLRKGWKGVKTGFTKTAGACFCGYWVEESYHIILTLLGCDTL